MKICIITLNDTQRDDRLYYKIGRSLAKIAEILILNPTFITSTGNPQLLGISNQKKSKYDKFSWFIKTLTTEQPDIIHVTHPALLIIAGKIKQKFGAKIVYDPAEDWKEMVRELSRSPWLKKQLMAYSIQGIELLYRRKIDLILASDNWLYSYYKKKGETLLLYNYPNLDLFSNYKSKNNTNTIVYHGQMIQERGIFDLINAVSTIIETYPNISLKLIGKFTYKIEAIKARELVNKNKINENVQFYELIDHAHIPAMLAKADIGVSPLQNIKKFQRNIPTKIFEYMACGLSVIASDLVPTKKLKYSEEWCTFYKAGNINDLIKVLTHLLDNKYKINPVARQLFEEEFNWESQENKLLLQYKNLFNS